MKRDRKSETRRVAPVPVAPAARPQSQILAAGALAGLVAVLWAYSPAIRGPFLFDDQFLFFGVLNPTGPVLDSWLHSQRPLLMATYWLSGKLSPVDTWWFHFMNVAIHTITSGMVFFLVRRLLEWLPQELRAEESKRNLLAGLGALLFLLHPVQTEAVAYLSGRSESLSVMWAFAAFTVFLYRRQTAATWGTAAAVFLLFGAALASKEQTIALPALFLLTDYWWNPGFSLRGIRDNWRIYAPMAAAGAAAVWFFRGLITGAATAGFGFKEFTWYQYFFTQCRALFVYIGLFFFPARLNADWDFAISKSVLDRGAIFGLAALVGIAVAAWHWRRRFPLASYGYFAFLLLMAPTSSILPIQDPIAERRLYFGILGLLLIVVDMAARIKVERKVLAGAGAVVVLVLTLTTYARAEVWSDAVVLWKDTVSKSPQKWRPHSQLAYSYFSLRECDLAVQEYEKTAALHPADSDTLLDWGLSYDCLNQLDEALQKLQQAVVLKPSAHGFSQVAMVFGKKQMWSDALTALAVAERLDPRYPDTYVYRGIAFTQMGQSLNAVQEFQRALSLDPNNSEARKDLQQVLRQLRANPGK